MIHTISQPDWAAGDVPRSIVWNDETGEVSGTTAPCRRSASG